MPDTKSEDIINLPQKEQKKMELFRDDLFMLRCKCGLSLAEVSELCGFEEKEIRAQEEKTAPLHVGIIIAVSLVCYILMLTDDKNEAKKRLRFIVAE